MRTKKNTVNFVVENIDVDAILGKKKRAKKIVKESVMKLDKPAGRRGRPRKNKNEEMKTVLPKKDAKKLSVKKDMPIDANDFKAIKPLIKEAKVAVKNAENECKKWAKRISKIADDETKQKVIAKLIDAGFSFGVDDPTKMVVEINVGFTISPKMKKLRNGAKANKTEKKAVAVQTDEKIDEPKTEIVNEPKVEEQPNENEIVIGEQKTIFGQPIEIPEEEAKAMAEVLIGDAYTDNPIEGPTDDELQAIEDEENDVDSDVQPNEDDELASYREEFFQNLAEDGDDQ